ncbi:3337_t:CDS:2, partial [Gigaspora rosea]
QNYYYVPDVEESSSEESLEIEETLEEKDPFLNLADHMALLKSQLKSELPNTLNAINVTFTVDKDIIFENSNRMDNKSKPTLPLQYTRKEFHMPPLNPTNLPAIIDSKNLLDKSLNPVETYHKDLPLLYAEVESDRSSNSSIEWEGASYVQPNENEDFYNSDANDLLDEAKRKLKIEKDKKKLSSVIYLYDINGNIYLREDKFSIDPRGFISLENLKEKINLSLIYLTIITERKSTFLI